MNFSKSEQKKMEERKLNINYMKKTKKKKEEKEEETTKEECRSSD